MLQTLKDYGHQRHSVWGITARNREQNFALNVLMNPAVDFVTLLGQAGTGKTLLTLAAGLTQVLEQKVYSEIIMTRVTVPVGEDIGFLPGTEEEKMNPWMGALEDNLDVLNKTDEEAGEWGRAATRDLIRSRIKVKSLNFMRGRTFIQKYLIIDEAQNLTPKQMKTLVTRAGPGTKVVCLGNIAQIDTPYLTEGSSGLTYVVDRMKGWAHGGHVTLTRGERSRLADYAAEALEERCGERWLATGPRARPDLSCAVLKAAWIRVILEPRELAAEGELHHSDGAVALLADDDLREPLVGRFGVVHLVAVDEEDHVRVLLDGARLPQVRHHRAPVGARLHAAIQLRQRHDRHVQLLGERLQRARDLRELGCAVLAVGARARHELQVVHHDQAQLAAAPVEAARAGAQLERIQRAAVVDEDARVLQALEALGDAAPVVLLHAAGADLVLGDARERAQQAHRDLLPAHLHAEHRDGEPEVDGDVLGDIEREGGLAHRGPARHDDEVRGLEARSPASRGRHSRWECR